MDRGAWWAIVHGVTESDVTEQLMLALLNKQTNVVEHQKITANHERDILS